MNDLPAVPFEDVLDRLPEPDRAEVLRAYHDALEHYRKIRAIREAQERKQPGNRRRWGNGHRG